MNENVSVAFTSQSVEAGELHKRLSLYGMTALAISGVLIGSQQSAHAAIVFNGPGLPLTTDVNTNPILFDFGTGLAVIASTEFPSPRTGQFVLRAAGYSNAGADVKVVTGLVLGGTSHSLVATDPGGEAGYAHKFALGDPISGGRFNRSDAGLFSSTHVNTRASYHGEFLPGTNHGILGFSFELPSTGSSQYFGWADISVDAVGDITLNGFAYNNTPGGPIVAGLGSPVVPEASPLLLLLAGGPVAMAAYRQARKRNESDRAN